MTAFTLKIIAMILMVGDHMHQFLPHQPVILTLLGRLVSPIFTFFMVEGFIHTRSKTKYATRLLIGGVIMLIGNQFLPTIVSSDKIITNNIFFSLFTTFCMIWAIDTGRKTFAKNKALSIGMFIIAIAFAGATLFTEGSAFTLSEALVFYFTINKKRARIIAYIITTFMVTIGININMFIDNPLLFTYDLQWFEMFAIIPICFYNGKRGLNTKFSKNLFYYFYPIHIWILYTIGSFLR